MRERLRLAQERPLVWQGDLSSDCRASWAGFFLRARARESNRWYWVVYDHWSDDSVVAHSVGDLEIQPTTGAEAREQAEMATKAIQELTAHSERKARRALTELTAHLEKRVPLVMQVMPEKR